MSFTIMGMDIIQDDILTIELTETCAALHSIVFRKTGREVTLKLADEMEHACHPSYSGNTILPFAGRIKGAVFDSTRLDANDGANSLHGGSDAHHLPFEKAAATQTSVTYRLTRRPGEDCLDAMRTYTVTYALENGCLNIRHEMDSDRPVLVDTTCHLYLNLDGSETVRDHIIKVDSNAIVLNDSGHCAREIVPTAGTPFDLSKPRRLGDLIDLEEFAFSKGVNNAYVLDNDRQVVLSTDELSVIATSDSDAVVLYSGGYLDKPHSHIAIEFESLPFADTRPVLSHYSRSFSFRFCQGALLHIGE